MLKTKEIKNGNLVFDCDNKIYGYLHDVGDAVAKGDRGNITHGDGELSYSILDIVTKKVNEGVCQHSETNHCLTIATTEDVDIYLKMLEAESLIKLAEARKENIIIIDALNRFNKMKNQKETLK